MGSRKCGDCGDVSLFTRLNLMNYVPTPPGDPWGQRHGGGDRAGSSAHRPEGAPVSSSGLGRGREHAHLPHLEPVTAAEPPPTCLVSICSQAVRERACRRSNTHRVTITMDLTDGDTYVRKLRYGATGDHCWPPPPVSGHSACYSPCRQAVNWPKALICQRSQPLPPR